jgi:hypothetical protein
MTKTAKNPDGFFSFSGFCRTFQDLQFSLAGMAPREKKFANI